MNRKTCETVNASIVEAIPKSTNSVIQPDALRVSGAAAAAAMPADYKEVLPSPALAGLGQGLSLERLHRQIDRLRRGRLVDIDDKTPVLRVVAPRSRRVSQLNRLRF